MGWACVTHPSFYFEKTLYRTFHDASYQFRFIWPSGFQRRIFSRNRPIRNKNCLWCPCLLTDRNLMSNLYRGPSKDASNQVSVHLVKRFQRRFFRNQPIRNKNCQWWPCLITDRNKMSNLYRGPSKDASYQVSVHLAKRFQRKNVFYKLTNQKQELPMVAMFVNG